MSAEKSGDSLGVVLIDSDEKSRGQAKSFLSAQGYQIAGEAKDLAAGMPFIRGGRPDLLILELPDHNEDTLEGVRRLRSDFPRLGIILSSTNSSTELVLRSIRAGAQEFLVRPLNIKELGEEVGD